MPGRSFVTNSEGERYQFTGHEFDSETTYDYHGARYYNRELGRYMSVDPLANKAFGWSPYRYGFDNPIIYVDLDGRYETKKEAKKARKEAEEAGYNVGEIEKRENGEFHFNASSDKEWATFNSQTEFNSLNTGNTSSFTGKGQLHNSFPSFSISLPSWDDVVQAHSAVWNSSYVRSIIPDVISVGVGFNGIVGVGASTNIDFNLVLRGPEASWTKPVVTITESTGAGFSLNAALNTSGFSYLGSVNDIERKMLQTNVKDGDVTYWGSFGGNAAGVDVGVMGSYTPTAKGYGIIGRTISFGIGAPVPGKIATGVSNTFILHDFAK